MADGVAGRVEKVEGAVAKVVKGAEAAYGERFVGAVRAKVEFDQLPVGQIALQDVRIRVGGVPWQHGLESRADNKRGFVRERRRVAYVIKVMVAPDYGLDAVGVNPGLVENLADIFLHVQFPSQGLDLGQERRTEVFPVLTDAEVKENGAVKAGVLDEEGEDGVSYPVVAFDGRGKK